MHIYFGDQYLLPQYSIFCYMSYYYGSLVIQLSMIPISLVYSFHRMNTSIRNRVGWVPSVKCQIYISACIGQHHLKCTAQSSVPSSHLLSPGFVFALTLITTKINGQHAVQTWTPLNSYGISWGELCRISVRLW